MNVLQYPILCSSRLGERKLSWLTATSFCDVSLTTHCRKKETDSDLKMSITHYFQLIARYFGVSGVVSVIVIVAAAFMKRKF
jgi:hypothetical protein